MGHSVQKVNSIPNSNDQASKTPHRGLRWLLILFLVIEYARPLAIAQLKLQLVIILVMAAAFLIAKDRPWSGILTTQLLFLFVIAKSLPFASNYYAVYLGAHTMLGYLIIAFALAWLMSWRAAFRQIIWAWVIILAYCAIYGIVHAGFGPGANWDENDLALACCVALPFVLFGFDYLRGWQRWASAGLAVLFVVAIVVSFSRGGFLGLAVVGLHYLLASRGRARKIFLAVVAISAFLTFAPQEYLVEIGTIQQDSGINAERDNTGTTRFFLWVTAFNMWKANPIMGVGAGNFAMQASEYQPTTGNWPSHYFERGWSGAAVHSVYFSVLSELGLPGIVLFVYIVWAYYHKLRSLDRNLVEREDLPQDLRAHIGFYGKCLSGAMLGFLIPATFLSTFYTPHVWYLTAMAVALETAFLREINHLRPQNEVPTKPARGRPIESGKEISIPSTAKR